jgi:hypothetical protein
MPCYLLNFNLKLNLCLKWTRIKYKRTSNMYFSLTIKNHTNNWKVHTTVFLICTVTANIFVQHELYKYMGHTLYLSLSTVGGPEQRSRYSDSLQAGWSGIQCEWGRDFLHPSRSALKPTQPPVQWVPGLFPRGKATGVWS